MPRAKTNKRRSTLGSIWERRQRWAAKYQRDGQWHTPGTTFTTFALADQWLCDEQRLIDRDEWTPPATRRALAEQTERRETTTLDAFARDYIENRRIRNGDPLAPRTRAEYRRYLDGILKPLAARAVVDITPAMVDQWWSDNNGTRTLRHHAYAFLKQVLSYAMTDRAGALIVRNPCQVDNAAFVSRSTPEAVRDQRIVNLTPAAVETLADEVDPRWRAFVLLLAYTAMRPGEAMALTRSSVTTTERDGVPYWCLAIKAAATTASDEDGRAVRVIGKTKTTGSVRYVYLPPHLVPVMREHLKQYAAQGHDGLIFPSTADPKTPATVQQVWGTSATKHREASGFHRARRMIGAPDLTIYDLRRWGRMTLRRAGMSDLDVEQYMGHALGRVTDAYAVVDPETAWAVVLKASELAGWVRPASDADTPIPARLLDAMTTEQLTATLASMTAGQLEKVAPLLAPETLARALSGDGVPGEVG